jgi:nitroimidazol reductase NimA-like FMN-containing flavoprotein (pyridoxamine 5'-phosphate oxidase superfamily)
MDTGQGRFEKVNAENEKQLEEMKKLLESQYPQHGGWFREGEVVTLKGSTFRVKRIKPTEITLKLMKRAES